MAPKTAIKTINTKQKVDFNDQIATLQTAKTKSTKLLIFHAKIAANKIAKQKPKLDSKKVKSKTKETKTNTNETGKLIVNSLRLLHETFLYFEIGSNQVANNDNNFCNKIKPR